MDILIATGNKNKIKEIQAIMESVIPGRVHLVSPSDLSSDYQDVEETGATLEENSGLKARYYYDLFRLPAIADDTGLEIESLGNQPGVFSARFAGIEKGDSANRAKVLDLMRDIPFEQRIARFRTVISFFDGNVLHNFEGICKGKIGFEEKGSNGFGYDSIFIPDGFDITFAEMTPELKNSISHRKKAIDNFISFLSEL